jgi:hypothetical protein
LLGRQIHRFTLEFSAILLSCLRRHVAPRLSGDYAPFRAFHSH